MPSARALAPGLLLIAAATAVAILLNSLLPLLSALLVAIIAGVALRNLGLIRPAAEPGVTFAAKKILRLGVVLLGFQLSLPVILDLGWGAIAVIVLTVTVTFLGTLLAGRMLGLPQSHRLLVATGTSICGASAVAAMAAVVQRPDGPGATADGADEASIEDAAATAVASVTLFGTISLIVLPLMIGALTMAQDAGGVWVGAAVHEVGQVVAGGGLVGPEALETAVITKLGRVVLLAPIVLLVGIVLARAARLATSPSTVPNATSTPPTTTKAPPLMPLFVLGFIATAALRSVLGLHDEHPAAQIVQFLSTLTLTAAMVGLGAGVKIKTLAATGGPIVGLTAIASVIAAVVSFLGVQVLV